MVVGVYSNLYYPTRWVPLKRRGLGWHKCCDVYKEHNCVASCGLAERKILEVVLDLKGCNLNCKYCWGWKMRYEGEEIRKSPEEVVKDILCQIKSIEYMKKKGYEVGVVRFTGNEPTLQWDHLIEVLKLLDEREMELKVIIETNGVLAGMGKLKFEYLDDLNNLRVDIDVSFKGVNYEQFEWLSSMPAKLFHYQIEGFVKMFDYFEDHDRINVNPVLGINHEDNYCIVRHGKRYFMKVEVIDKDGNKLDFYDYSKDFEELVLDRKNLRYDEAPFREYFGINKESTRLVVAVIYKGKRFLRMLPSEVVQSLLNLNHLL